MEFTSKKIDVTGVALALKLRVGQTVALDAMVEPEGATNKTATWTSSDENVAIVNKDGEVTAVGY